MPNDSIALNNISFRYERCPVFLHCSCDLPVNTVCFGPNGCGKSTLLRLIAGILTPHEGSITFCERCDFRSSILMNHRILFQDIALKQQLHWIAKQFHIADSEYQLHIQRFELDALLERSPAEMSDGQKQWASLAAAALIPADLYLFDEPLRTLDTAHVQVLCGILRDLTQRGKRLVATAHAPEPLSSALTPFDMHALMPHA